MKLSTQVHVHEFTERMKWHQRSMRMHTFVKKSAWTYSSLKTSHTFSGFFTTPNKLSGVGKPGKGWEIHFEQEVQPRLIENTPYVLIPSRSAYCTTIT